MTENYGIEGWNSPSIFFFLVPDKQWGGCSGRKYYFRFYMYLF